MMNIHMENTHIHYNSQCLHLTGMNKDILAVIGAVVLVMLSGLGLGFWSF